MAMADVSAGGGESDVSLIALTSHFAQVSLVERSYIYGYNYIKLAYPNLITVGKKKSDPIYLTP